MKRMTAIALLVCFTLMFAQGSVCSEGIYSDPELARAVALGFGEYKADDPPISYAEFFKMLDRSVELADSAKLTTWQGQYTDARKSSEKMTRSDGMFAILLAAEVLGEKYAGKNTDAWHILWEEMENWGGRAAQEYEPNIKMFPEDLQNAVPSILFNPQDVVDGIALENRRNDAFVYASTQRRSLYSGELMFEYDKASNNMRAAAPFLYTEALLASLRLHDSGLDGERVLTDADRRILGLAEDRKQAILNSATTIEVTGKKYYVSNNGNDDNDGKSPETAWASIKKVNSARLKPGDGVFFKRGDLWRDYSLRCQKGVTYSAYGEGEKPRFYGSPENGANPDYWSLVPGSSNVWVYHIEMRECGLIVFNDGEKLAEKYPAFWDMTSQQYVISLDMQMAFTVDVLENNWFFNETDLKGMKISMKANDATAHFENGSALTFWGMDKKGKLYLRCDEGNPGAVYHSIEFSADPYGGKEGCDIIQQMENAVIDNLCLVYAGNAVAMIRNDATIQNCEIKYTGGGAYAYMLLEKAPFEPESLRDLICFDGVALVAFDPSNVRIENNYIHDCFSKAFNIEHHLKHLIENVTISGNLFERNGQGGNLLNFFPGDNEDKLRFKDITFDNNYWMYTGYGWGVSGNHDDHAVFNFEYYRPNQFDSILFSNNIFYLSKGALFATVGKATLELFDFSGNTYVHTNGGIFLYDYGESFFDWELYYYDMNADETIKQLTGDESAIVLPPSFTVP